MCEPSRVAPVLAGIELVAERRVGAIRPLSPSMNDHDDQRRLPCGVADEPLRPRKVEQVAVVVVGGEAEERYAPPAYGHVGDLPRQARKAQVRPAERSERLVLSRVTEVQCVVVRLVDE